MWELGCQPLSLGVGGGDEQGNQGKGDRKSPYQMLSAHGVHETRPLRANGSGGSKAGRLGTLLWAPVRELKESL